MSSLGNLAVLKWLKKVAQDAKDFGASFEYREAFDRLRGVDDYLLDFDVSKLPEHSGKIDLDQARALGTATALKQIAKRGELLRSAHTLDMGDGSQCVTATWPIATKLTLATSLLPNDHRDRDGEEPSYFASSRDAIITGQDWHFARSIASMSEAERLVWKSAMYWESQGLHESAASDIHLLICWAGKARLYASKPSFMGDLTVWPLYLAEVDKLMGDAIRGSYAEFLEGSVIYFAGTADHARLKRLKKFDDEDVIGRIGRLSKR